MTNIFDFALVFTQIPTLLQFLPITLELAFISVIKRERQWKTIRARFLFLTGISNHMMTYASINPLKGLLKNEY